MFSLRAALAVTLHASAVPYGYTLTIWSTGSVLMAALGTPPVLATMEFVAGAVAAYGLLTVLSHNDIATARPHHGSDYRIIGRLHWLPIVLSIVLAVLITHVAYWWAWPLGSFAATSTYVLATSSHLALRDRRRGVRMQTE